MATVFEAVCPDGHVAILTDTQVQSCRQCGATLLLRCPRGHESPLTADRSGNIFFGYQVTGSNPANLPTGGGIARISLIGTATFLLLEEGLSRVTEYSGLVIGPALLLVAIFMRGGIDGFFAGRRRG